MGNSTRFISGTRHFTTTRWSLVRDAGDFRAAGLLLRMYWKPLYFFVRHHSFDSETAKDIVQEFLTDLLERRALLKADPARGRFRTFLRASMSNFLKDWIKSAGRRKRRPAGLQLSLDFRHGESDYGIQAAASAETPDRVLDRAWARSLWEDALAHLEGEASHLAAFRLYLADADYHAITRKTGLSESAAKVAVHRLKAQFRDLVVGRIRETVCSEKDLQAELAEFKSFLG